jgi:TatD DNase family protein
LAPHPHRGKRNESAYVRLVAEEIAVLRGLEYAEIVNITNENARRLFSIP